MRNCFITLGAFGDCINTLPLVWRDAQLGNTPTFLIARQFASLLDGVSYCDREIWDGHYSESQAAFDRVKQTGKYDNVYLAQCYGTNVERLTDSYAKESWRLVGALEHWGKLPLIFDLRSIDREIDLLAKVGERKNPIVLVSTSGHSSPFPYKDQLLDALKPLRNDFDFVDLDLLQAEKLFDLIGLMKNAACLIATDSGPLHLAQAVPELPVIALVTHSPDLWHGSPRRPSHLLYIRYNEFPKRMTEIQAALRMMGATISKPAQKLIHVWSDYDRRDPAALRRHRIARQTWNAEYSAANWIQCVVHENQATRNANMVGEDKPVPFVRDLFIEAANRATPQDVIVFTNDDTCLIPGASKVIMDRVQDFGAVWCARREIISVSRVLTAAEILKGYKHCGADIFAFSREWWDKWGEDFPDFLLSFEAWDLVLKKLIHLTRGIEVHDLCYHEIHTSYWHMPAHRECAGNLYNRELTRQWLAKHNIEWGEAFK